MPTKVEIIGATYKKYLGSKAQTLARIKKEDQRRSEEEEDYEPSGITKKDVDEWFLNHDQLAPALKAPCKTIYNSFVDNEPRNTFQVDLFNSNTSRRSISMTIQLHPVASLLWTSSRNRFSRSP